MILSLKVERKHNSNVEINAVKLQIHLTQSCIFWFNISRFLTIFSKTHKKRSTSFDLQTSHNSQTTNIKQL